MGGRMPSQWPLVLVHILLLQLQPVKVQREAHLELRSPMNQKVRRLDEQFRQFQALTQARLDMLALNQNRNFSGGLENRVQALTDQYHRISQDLGRLRQSTTQEMDALREWSRKLEKRSKRMEGRMALMERNLRENIRRHIQKQRPNLGQDFSNLTLELQSQEERLDSLAAQRDELILSLKGLQESLKNQEIRMDRLEGRLSEVLQGNTGGYTRGSRTRDPLTTNVTPQEYYEPRRRNQMPRRGRPARILDRPEDTSYSQAPSQSRSPFKPYQHKVPTPNQPKYSKAKLLNKMLRPKLEPQPQPDLEQQTQFQYPNHQAPSSEFQPPPEPYQRQQQQHPQSLQYPTQQQHSSQLQPQPHHSVPYRQSQIPPQVKYPTQVNPYPETSTQFQGSGYPSWLQSENYHQSQSQSETQAQPEPIEDRWMRTRFRTPPPQVTQPQLHPNMRASDFHPQLQSESLQPQANKWIGQDQEERDAKAESSEIQSFLQLPVRHKIPAQPAPKKDATICNVDSMLFFPSASVENYVTFSLSFPNLPELSVCMWLRVEDKHIGTLLSYATDDSDNQLVLYGRSASGSSASSSSQSSLLSSSSSSSPTLDFVVGDPVYRRLPAASLLDGHWHHLCVLWSSIQGRFWHYTDRRLTSSGSNFQKGWEVPGGGSVVLGQEQDTVGGGFDPVEGFAGRMAGFRVWDRVLSPLEVEGVADGRGVPRGVVLSMEDIKEVHGEVKQVACECLEHCV